MVSQAWLLALGASGALLIEDTRPAVNVPLVETAPVVDCRLDDDVWTRAARLHGFVQTHPGDNARASRATEVLLAYTPQALYVGLRAEDDPGRVRATLAGRDAIGEDDGVTLYLDTFHDRRRAYVVAVNPLGVQQDGVFAEGQEPDYSVDLVLQSAGCLTDDGYAVELGIPFESLRYQAGPGRSWGVHVLRQIKHLDEEDSWMPLQRNRVGVEPNGTRELRARFLAQAGSLAGLDHARHVPSLEWIPVAGVTRPEGAGTDLALGGTAHADFSPSLAGDLALNPDFAEVEADQPQSAANQRFPLFFEEKRPFFLEGADLLRTPLRAFHSRSLVDPDAALRLARRHGRTSAAALVALDAAPGHLTAAERADPALAPLDGRRALAAVLRARRDVGLQSSVGLLGTAWRFAGRHNVVAGVDGRLALGARSVWTFQALGSASRLPYADTGLRRGLGLAYSSDWALSGSRFSFQATGEGYSPDYRAALGYTQRTDTHRWSLLARYNAPPAQGGLLVAWSLLETTLVQFDWRGRMQYAYAFPRVHLTLPRQSFLRVAAYRDYARVFEEELGAARGPGRPGAFAGSSERSGWYHGFTVEAGSAPSQKVSASLTWDRSWNNLDLDQGAGRFPRVSPAALADPHAPLDPGPGRYRYLAGTLSLQPSEALRLSASWEHGRLTRNDTGRDAFDQHLLSLRAQYAFSRFASLRARLDHDSLDGRVFHQAVFAWTPRPGTALYLGYDETGEWSENAAATERGHTYTRRSRTLFAKLSWALRQRWDRAPAADYRASRMAWPTSEQRALPPRS